MTQDGVVVVDKPAGMTSHDVVDRVRRVFSTRRVGHAGTLDPDATGILVLGLGRATRFLSYSQSAPKRYRATARFGVSTSTQDASGDVVSTRAAAHLDLDAVAAAARSFVGEIEQVPPMVSAVKIGGERLYRKARRGEEVERPARAVTVYGLDVTSFEPGVAPSVTLDVRCSAGTYVRTLVHDLGERLGCGAHLASLRRIEAGGFTEADALALDALDSTAIRPLEDIVAPLMRLELDEQQTREVADGKPIAAPTGVEEDARCALFSNGRLLAVYRRAGELLKAETVVGDLATRR
ncbi:MAG TPA: tRNA pseudouridine(55) synthase TruB [Actinomycetota bacterium]|nr:tRNA pseudouridine(55) synthase TruB [Actinomycetota bacterium]